MQPPKKENEQKVWVPRSKPAGMPIPRRRKKPKKHPMMRKMLVVLAGGCLLFLLVYLLGMDWEPEAPPSSSFSPPVSSAPSSVPQPESVWPAIVPTQYDEAETPLLLNARNMVPEDYVLDLENVGNGQTMQARAAAAFKDMQAAAKAGGVSLNPISGYRTNERQTRNYNASIQRYLDQGYSKEEAEKQTRRYYAIPGTSEHEAGLAMDIGSIDESFANTKAFEWLQQHCEEYGFIFRYRKETEEVTGIAYEPWHYRYVGANHAQRMKQQGFVTLEEYVESLQESPSASQGG